MPVSKRSSKDEPTANATPKKSISEADLLAPQSIAIVAGRKYIMVPKAAKVHPSPDSTNGNQTTKSS